jgi:hypothetical protein
LAHTFSASLMGLLLKSRNNLLVLWLATFFFSCTTDHSDDVATVVEDTVATEMKDTTTVVQDFFYSLPSPMVMVKMFKRSGLKYVEGISNSPANATRYATTEKQALNVGVYTTDLAYAVVNKQNQQAANYMEAIKAVSNELGMASLFDPDHFIRRFKANLTNDDSLILIIAELKSEMDIYARDNEKEKNAVLIFVGAWAENLYTATRLVADEKGDSRNKLMVKIAEQKFILNGLMDVLKNYKNDVGITHISLKLKSLKSVFDQLATQGENEALMMDEENLNSIIEKTAILRNEITQ